MAGAIKIIISPLEKFSIYTLQILGHRRTEINEKNHIIPIPNSLHYHCCKHIKW